MPVKSLTTPGNNLASKLNWIHNTKIAVKIKGICLKQDKATFTQRNVLNQFFLSSNQVCGQDFTLGNCLFGAAKLTKNVDPDKYRYGVYGIGFDARP